ncbi:MAG: KamA family radical SAM protein [Pleomorphochaeta sp.]
MEIEVHNFNELKKKYKLTKNEMAFKESENTLPISITKHFLSLINLEDENDPLRIQVFPNVLEEIDEPLEDIDPLEEVNNTKTNRLIHRYDNRVALLTTDICPMYCRHCFRRRFTGKLIGPIKNEEIIDAANYIQNHPEITEILLTGGDLLTLSDTKLEFLIKTLRDKNPKLIMRICTRMVVTAPSRVTENLINIFKKYDSAPFYLLTQVNHPRELEEKSIKAISMFIDAGIPALNQTVMLKGVNDNFDIMEELCKKLLFNRIKPYYVFQGDLVSGTAHLRVNVNETMKIEKEMRKRLSGLAMPNFMIDLPKGGGKVPLSQCYLKEVKNNTYVFYTLNGETRKYPHIE